MQSQKAVTAYFQVSRHCILVKQNKFQQTRDVDPMLIQCWFNIKDDEPMLNQHWVNVPCLLGCTSLNLKASSQANGDCRAIFRRQRFSKREFTLHKIVMSDGASLFTLLLNNAIPKYHLTVNIMDITPASMVWSV